MPSDPAVPAADDAPAAAAATPETPARACQNCGEPLLGEHCYSCGQPTKGLVRHFSSIIGDFMDSAFNLDTRMLRTVYPLLFKPGYLSNEYFAGRRVRYVSPVRLFVFLSIVTFFAAQLSFDIDRNSPDGTPVVEFDDVGDTGRLREATTVAEVEKIRDDALAELRKAKEQAGNVPGVSAGMEAAEQAVVAQARERIEALQAAEKRGEPPPAPLPGDNDGQISFNGKPWDPVTNPVNIDWLPDAANRKLNQQAGRAKGNIREIRDDPNKLKDAFLSTVPTTLFVLLPLFALLLKVAYLFKRRLYMEHLIVALHSHSFLCFGLLLAIFFDALTAMTAGVAGTIFRGLEIAVLVWLPIYLLLMQKRVYRQGWIMTLLKYGVLGTCYLFLISFGAAASLMISLVSM